MQKPQIVVLDGNTMNPGDLSWEPLSKFGNPTIYDRTPETLVLERAKDAQIIITNKVVFSKKVLDALPSLQLICVASTGYNTIDISAAQANGVKVCNVVGYAAPSVAQHVFAQILHIRNNIYLHNLQVQNKKWSHHPDWSFTEKKIEELAGQTMGIYGLGMIGTKVAEIALAFGMRVIATRKNPTKHTRDDIQLVPFETLIKESDVLSLHAAMSDENKGIINRQNLSKMKTTSSLINTGRGGLINEADLKWALENEVIAYAALDVLSQEPPPENHILFGLDNCIITPHNAWASIESRQRLMDGVIGNIEQYLELREDFVGIEN